MQFIPNSPRPPSGMICNFLSAICVNFKGSKPDARTRRLAQSDCMVTVQIFGLKNSSATRAAERFFKERRASIQLVDLKQKPMAPGEIKRFIQRFGLAGVLEDKAYLDEGLKYLKLSDAELL